MCMPPPHLSPSRLLARYLDDGEQLGYVTARGSRLVFDALLRERDPASPSGGAWSGSLRLSWPGGGACGGNGLWPPLDAVAFLGVPPPVDMLTVYCLVHQTAAVLGMHSVVRQWLAVRQHGQTDSWCCYGLLGRPCQSFTECG